MHGALLGVSKQLLTLWFGTKSVGTGHDLRANIATVNAQLQLIAVPSEISRKPRDVSEAAHWKGMNI